MTYFIQIKLELLERRFKQNENLIKDKIESNNLILFETKD